MGGGSAAPAGPFVASYAETETESSPLLSKAAEKSSGKKASKGIPLVGAGVSTFWHEWQMCRLGRGVEPDINMSWLGAALWEGVVFAVIGAVLGVFRRK